MDLTNIEQNSQQIDEMVNSILGNSLVDLDQYIAQVKTCFLTKAEILDQDLEQIIRAIPVYLYSLIPVIQRIETRKGIATENAKYVKNDCLLNYSGTIADKTARAENSSMEDRLKELAFKTASSLVQKKIDGANSILDSAKKIQQQRLQERKLTYSAGSSVGAF